MRLKAAVCAPWYRPGQPGVMRPLALTQVISANTRPAPPIARAPRCTRGQSLTRPSCALYCAIGETTMRFLSVRPRTVQGVNIGGGAGGSGGVGDGCGGGSGGQGPGGAGEPALVAGQPVRVAQAQVFVADALAAREHGVHELRAFELVAVALAA